MFQLLEANQLLFFNMTNAPLHFYSVVTTFLKRQLPEVWFGQGVAHFLVSEISILERLDFFPGTLWKMIFTFYQHLQPPNNLQQ